MSNFMVLKDLPLSYFASIPLFALFLIASACTTSIGAVKQSDSDQPANSSNVEAVYNGPEETISPLAEDETFFSPVPRKFVGLEVLRNGPIAVRVRMARPADLVNFGRLTETEAMTVAFASIIVVGGAFGAAALPLLGAYAAWGTIFFGGAVPGGLAFEQHRQASIAEAIAKVDLPKIVETALRRRLVSLLDESIVAPSSDLDIEREVEVVILSYGFLWNSAVPDTACSFLQAEIRLTIPNHETQKDWVYMEPSRRSDDSPPAYCSYSKRLFADDSALARQALSDNAEILASIVARRLESSQ
jgi:hypothetical protein